MKVSDEWREEIDNCPFCQRVSAGEFTSGHDPRVVQFEPLNPVTQGHMLFVPLHHVTWAQQTAGWVSAYVTREAVRWQMDQRQACNLIYNSGSAASQTVPHLHLHYVPREEGDGLILPWT